MKSTISGYRVLFAAVLCAAGSLVPPVVAQPTIVPIDNMTIYVKEPVRFGISAAASGSTLTYSVLGLPAGATINTTTGWFTWQPVMDDTGTYTATFTVSDGADQTSVDVAIDVVMPTLPPGSAFQVLRPNGGEVYTYGDSINLVFMAPVCETEAQVWFCWGKPPGFRNLVMYTSSAAFWPALGGDTLDMRGVACRYYYTFPDQGVNVGFYRMALHDTTVEIRRLNLGGDTVRVDSMLFKVADQYGDSKPCDFAVQQRLLTGDLSNGYFSVKPRGKAGVIRGVHYRDIVGLRAAMPRAIRIYSITGRRIREAPNPGAHGGAVLCIVNNASRGRIWIRYGSDLSESP